MNDTVASQLPAFLQSVQLQKARRPRIALMGEFSAGKSTLANLMIGSEPLPVQIIATQMPPVWISHGDGEAFVVSADGEEKPCDLKTMRSVVPESTAYIRAFAQEDILRLVDIIDMPGISDPNMSSVVWERILPLADGVIWCSASTQAWRQSEASVWDAIPERVRARSLLLLTRADMLSTDRDKSRVFKRVLSETNGLFAKRQMISLIDARDAGDCAEKWAESGAEDFVNAFLDIVAELRRDLGSGDAGIGLPGTETTQETVQANSTAESNITGSPADKVSPRRPVSRQGIENPAADPDTGQEEQNYMPRFS